MIVPLVCSSDSGFFCIQYLLCFLTCVFFVNKLTEIENIPEGNNRRLCSIVFCFYFSVRLGVDQTVPCHIYFFTVAYVVSFNVLKKPFFRGKHKQPITVGV